jgi:glycosyltransferase involved in cell wall biosynthesis
MLGALFGMIIIVIAFAIMAALLAVPTLVLLIEVLCGKSLSQAEPTSGGRSKIAAMVIVPAHNEKSGISATVTGLMTQIDREDRVVVVADNCNDETAALARSAGAEVLERFDAVNRGKGYALAHGLEEARRSKVDVVIFVDADCSLSPGAIGLLKERAWTLRRPVQAAFVMEAPAGHERRYAVATFAWRVKNLVRPLGLKKLGLPCQMMGTGMAMRLDIANAVAFASGNIVEDLELGLNLASHGHPPVLEPGVLVRSIFPVTQDGEIAQRRRWEGGSMAMLAGRGARVIGRALVRGNLPLLALGLDMLVPPLVTHAALLVVFFGLSALVSLFVWNSFAILTGTTLMIMFAVSIAIAWLKAGRDVLPLHFWRELLPFLLKKLKIHKSLPGTHTTWVRADRRKSDGE